MLNELIYYTSVLSPLPSIFIGRRERHILWYYAIGALLSDFILHICMNDELLRKIIIQLFLIIEFALITAFFSYELSGKRRIGLIASISVLLAIWSAYYITTDTRAGSLDMYNGVINTCCYVSYIVLALLGFYTILKKAPVVMLTSSGFFMACVAILIYASGVSMILLFQYYLEITDKELIMLFWRYVFRPMNILKNLLIAIALYNYKFKESAA